MDVIQQSLVETDFVLPKKALDHQDFWADFWDHLLDLKKNASAIQYMYYTAETRGSACVPVEEFNKHMSRVWRFEKCRAHTSAQYGEDVVRIRQNMPPPFDTDHDGRIVGLDYSRLADVWTTQFQHQEVRTERDVKLANDSWQGSADQAASLKYKRANRTAINKYNKEKRRMLKVRQDEARGDYNPGPGRYHFKDKRPMPLTVDDEPPTVEEGAEVASELVQAIATSRHERSQTNAGAADRHAAKGATAATGKRNSRDPDSSSKRKNRKKKNRKKR